jgi:hypothetical protein
MTVDSSVGEQPAEDDNANSEARARYVVGRLAEAVPGPSGQDWDQIEQELARAYKAIDNAQRKIEPTARLRNGLGYVLAFAVTAMFQWQLDLLWAGRGFSSRVFLLPIVMIVAAPLIWLLIIAVTTWILYTISRHWIGWILVTISAVGLAGATFALVKICDYSWPQALVIATVEPMLWLIAGVLVPGRITETYRRAEDPRDQLIADLTTFLAVSAVTLQPERYYVDWQPPAWTFPPLRWHGGMTYPAGMYASRERQRDRSQRVLALHGTYLRDRFRARAIARHAGDPQSDSEEPRDPLPRALLIAGSAWSWRRNRYIRRGFAEGIEATANHFEFNLPKAAGRRETAVRSSVRHLSARIGASLRAYATDVVLGGAERDNALSAKLCNSLVAAAWGRWEELATSDPTPPVGRFIKRFGPNLAIAAVLVAAAIGLPLWLHEWIGEGVTQFRIAMLTAAVLAVTEAPRTTVERFAGFLQSFAGRNP